MVRKYRKKPVEIEAEQYTKYGKLVKGMCNSRSCYVSGNTEPHVHTIHAGQIVNLEVGDWVIPEPDGVHFYPCKPDIFAETYEPAEIELDGEMIPVEDRRLHRWEKAYEHAKEARGVYEEVPAGGLALQITILPAIRRYEQGERTDSLLEELEGISI